VGLGGEPRIPSTRGVKAAGCVSRDPQVKRAEPWGKKTGLRSAAVLFAGSLSRGREWDLSGSQATHPVPLPRSKTRPNRRSLANDGLVDAAPAAVKDKRLQHCFISGLPRGFSTCCLRFKDGVATATCRLASGWLAGLCREGVEPSGSLRKFPCCYISSPFPEFILTLDGFEHDGTLDAVGTTIRGKLAIGRGSSRHILGIR